MDKRTVFLVDDHPILREGLAQLINAEPDLEVCGAADGLSSAMKFLERRVPDLAVVDIFLEGANGIELTKAVRYRYPTMKVLILSMHDEDIYARRALRAGAVGYVMKQEVSSTILDAIRVVLKGGTYVSQRLAGLDECLAGRSSDPERNDYGVDCLSDREIEIYELFGRGLSRNDIAARIGVSVKTVEAHRANIKEKLGLKDAAELARRAMLWVDR